jgi:hypothetical protein
MENKMTAADFRAKLVSGEIGVGKKGKLVQGNVKPASEMP